MFYVYVLRSIEGKYYIGQTNNLERRLLQHLHKKVISTRLHNYQLVHYENYATRTEAILRERQLKLWKSKKAIEKLINKLG